MPKYIPLKIQKFNSGESFYGFFDLEKREQIENGKTLKELRKKVHQRKLALKDIVRTFPNKDSRMNEFFLEENSQKKEIYQLKQLNLWDYYANFMHYMKKETNFF
ncbi:MAG: hypothetical protein KC516_02425 [Nanoarchaeota archaeon]|nr:hypothetical protein [Nanoarchaeota archaeon]